MHIALEGLQLKESFARECEQDMSGKNPTSPQGVINMEKAPESVREIASEYCSDESQIFFLRPYPQHELLLQHPSASVFPALWSYSCAQTKSTFAAVREDKTVATCSFLCSWD